MDTELKNDAFYRCSMCGRYWNSKEDFLDDPEVSLVGYQVHFEELEEGFMLFNHSCRTTLAIQAGEFKYLYNGPIFKDKLTNTDTCPGHCLHSHDLSPCPNKCECSYVREILQVIKCWPKSP